MSKNYYNKPLIISYSGGKDSDVLLDIAIKCLNPDDFEVLNVHTSVDAPPTVYHIRSVFKGLNDKGIKTTVYQPKDQDGNPITMWNLIEKMQMPPTKQARYCCRVLKETSTPNRICAVGVREAEGANRQGRDIFNTYGKTKKDGRHYSLDHAAEVHQESMDIQDENWDCLLIKTMKENKNVVVNPIYYWSDRNVWEYAIKEQISMNPLYEMGYDRVGCVGCPLVSYKWTQKQFNDFPTYKQAYINAFDRMLKLRKASGKDDLKGGWHNWTCGKDVFEWWIQGYKRNCKGQLSLFGEDNE